MDNIYVEELTARARLDEARADAAERRLVASARPEQASLRQAIGLALIKVGRRLASEAPRYPAPDQA